MGGGVGGGTYPPAGLGVAGGVATGARGGTVAVWVGLAVGWGTAVAVGKGVGVFGMTRGCAAGWIGGKVGNVVGDGFGTVGNGVRVGGMVSPDVAAPGASGIGAGCTVTGWTGAGCTGAAGRGCGDGMAGAIDWTATAVGTAGTFGATVGAKPAGPIGTGLPARGVGNDARGATAGVAVGRSWSGGAGVGVGGRRLMGAHPAVSASKTDVTIRRRGHTRNRIDKACSRLSPKSPHQLGEEIQKLIDVGVGVVAPEADPQAASRHGAREAEGQQHVARLQ